MADNEITINDVTEGGSTANVDTKSLVGVGGKTVHRQAVVIGDPTTFGQVAGVNANGELKVKQTDAVAVTNSNLDATISSRATEATLAIISGNIADCEALLTTLTAKDFATQTTLALIKAKTDNLDVAISSIDPSEYTEDVPSIADPIGTQLITRRRDALAVETTLDGDNTALNSTGKGELYVKHVDAIPVTDNGGSLTVDGTVTSNVSDNAIRDNGKIDIAGFDVALPTGTNNIGDVDVLTLPALPAGTNNIGDVDVLTLPNVAQATSSNLKNEPNGNVAHGVADSGNPIKIGGKARTTNPTAEVDGDRVDATFDKVGRQAVVLSGVRDLIDTAVNASAITTTAETTIIPAVALVFHDVVAIVISNSSAVATLVQIRDTTTGTVIMNIYSPAGSTVGVSLPHPLPQATVNTNWTAQAVTTASSLFVTMQYVKNV
jgi:hypothetical protein